MHIQALPGANEHLTVIMGDVSDAAVLTAAMSHCEQLVHLAAVVDVRPPKEEKHRHAMIQTALDGTRIVLSEWLAPPAAASALHCQCVSSAPAQNVRSCHDCPSA